MERITPKRAKGSGELISWNERQRRMRAALENAWREAENAPEDPGLREAYAELPRAPIRLIACPLKKDVNQGGLLRLAEAFRIERIDFTPEEDGAVDFAGNRGTLSRQPFRWLRAEEAVESARRDEYRCYALTLSVSSQPIRQVRWSFPCALVLGQERLGIPKDIEQMCDESVAIPLYGLVTSLNVTTAAAIALHEAHAAYVAQNPEFVPARNASRELLGLPPIDYM